MLVALFLQSRFNIFPQLIASTTQSRERLEFPEVNEAGLSEGQLRLLAILRQEYEANPEGTKYSEGFEEPWCANFVGWVYNEAGQPLKNPYSGSWRIPGTYTLREYFESRDGFYRAGSEYTPKLGDVLLYDNPSPMGQHTNIVLNYVDGVVTTIGGNENRSIRISQRTLAEDPGFIGYGVF